MGKAHIPFVCLMVMNDYGIIQERSPDANLIRRTAEGCIPFDNVRDLVSASYPGGGWNVLSF